MCPTINKIKMRVRNLAVAGGIRPAESESSHLCPDNLRIFINLNHICV
jgi:hypothetical protein